MDYIEILKLLIKDNTNKDVINKYLKYLYGHGEVIKKKYKDI